jgi:hypothetical protein
MKPVSTITYLATRVAVMDAMWSTKTWAGVATSNDTFGPTYVATAMSVWRATQTPRANPYLQDPLVAAVDVAIRNTK